MGFFTKTGRIKYVRDDEGRVVDVIRSEDEGPGSRLLVPVGRAAHRELVDIGEKLVSSGRSLGRDARRQVAPTNRDLRERNEKMKSRLSPALERQKLQLEYAKLRNQRLAVRMVPGVPGPFLPPMSPVPPGFLEGYHVEADPRKLMPLPKGYRWVRNTSKQHQHRHRRR